MKILSLLILLISVPLLLESQTANDAVTPYTGPFSYGSNMGYYPPWNNAEQANIAAGNNSLNIAGAGVKSLRPALPEWFLETYGYGFNIPDYQHYQSLGIQENVTFIGYPSAAHRDPTVYCTDPNSAFNGAQSELFDNMYTPIWDNGANGTPVNDNNYYALYLYNMVTLHKPYVKFWEIWNEPDFDYGGTGWFPPGAPGNWWDNDPDACDMAILAPIEHYVRLLRISYEVIKSIDPDAYVCVGGLGYPAFLDAVLRNTDNPNGGSVTAAYPLTGGAYFDVMSYHIYPSVEGNFTTWNSDAAANIVLSKKYEFETVLYNYGYDGNTYPEKIWICTESNVPRFDLGSNYGGDMEQVNYIIKTLIKCQSNDIRQFYLYSIAELQDVGASTSSFDYMGLYEKITGTNPYNQVKTDQGIAYKTTSNLLYGAVVDIPQSNAMNLLGNVDGIAFSRPDGSYVYVLWAMTLAHQSENASANFTFPAAMNVGTLDRYDWDYSDTNNSTTTNPSNIALTGTPTFLIDNNVSCTPIIQHPMGNITQGTYNAGNYIESRATVSNSSTVNYYAGNFIDLIANFEVVAGGNFTAEIAPCFATPGPWEGNLNPSNQSLFQNPDWTKGIYYDKKSDNTVRAKTTLGQFITPFN